MLAGATRCGPCAPRPGSTSVRHCGNWPLLGGGEPRCIGRLDLFREVIDSRQRRAGSLPGAEVWLLSITDNGTANAVDRAPKKADNVQH